MYMLVDAGNTHIVMGLAHKQTIVKTWRFESKVRRTTDTFRVLLFSLLQMENIVLDHIQKIVFASVVPSVTDALLPALEQLFHCPVIRVTGQLPLSLTMDIEHPDQVGADLVANAVAAWKLYHKAAIIIDLGTATTIQLVTADGVFKGAVIIPGVETAYQHLLTSAALLRETTFVMPQSVLGSNTMKAVNAGRYFATRAMLSGMIMQIQQEFALSDCVVVATGGLANRLCQGMPEIDEIDLELTLKGLIYIAQEIEHENEETNVE